MRYSVLLFFFLIANCSLYAQVADSVFFEQAENSNPIQEGTAVDPSTLQNTKTYTTEKITVRKFDEYKWKKIVGSTDYNEDQLAESQKRMRDSTQANANKAKSGKRAYSREDDNEPELQEQEDSSITVGPVVALLLKILFYSAVILIIGFILYSIFKNTSFKTGLKNAKISTPDFTDHVEDIAELDVESLLKKTIAAGDFRLAIRMYFLGLLKKLNEDGFIVWKKDKTNRDYLNELFAKAYYFEEVRRLTLAYEQVWYGDHTLPAESYQQLVAEFKSIDQKLQTTKAK